MDTKKTAIITAAALPYLGPEIIEWLITWCNLDGVLGNKAGFGPRWRSRQKNEEARLRAVTKIETTPQAFAHDREGSEHVAR